MDMIEFKVAIEERVVEQVGYSEVNQYLQEFVQKLVLKIAAEEALQDLEEINLENDPQWQLARKLAWEQEKHKYAA